MTTIYLDQNKWIDLAKSLINPNEYPIYVDVLKLIQEKSNSGEWIFPISLVHHIETFSRGKDTSRQNLSKVMSNISKNNAIMSFNDIQKDEFFKAFSAIHDPKKIITIEVIKNNYFASVGSQIPKVEYRSQNPTDIEKEIVEEVKIFSEKLFKRKDLFEIFMKDPHKRRKMVEEFNKDDLQSKEEWVEWRNFYQKINKGQRYHAFLIRFFLEHFAVFKNDLLLALGKSNNEIIPSSILEDKNKTIELMESIPSLDVRAKLMYEVFNNTSKDIHSHDHRDVEFLATAIPYCDVVITERTWKHYSNMKKLNTKYNTTIENDLNYLLSI